MDLTNIKALNNDPHPRKTGEDFGLTVTFTDAITGLTFTAFLKLLTKSNTAVLTFTCSPDTGAKTVLITATNTLLDALDRGKYDFEFWVTDGTGFSTRLIYGKLDLTK